MVNWTDEIRPTVLGMTLFRRTHSLDFDLNAANRVLSALF